MFGFYVSLPTGPYKRKSLMIYDFAIVESTLWLPQETAAG
jgi:hypothetical protein